MGQRRITSANILAPVQEITVQPFSAFNSNNVNMLTRAVTGEIGKDIVVNGLDVFGVPVSSAEISEILVEDDFSSLSPEWMLSEFTYDAGNQNVKVIHEPSLSKYAELRRTDITFTKYKWYKIQFDLKNYKLIYDSETGNWIDTENQGTPLRVYVLVGGITRSFDYPVQQQIEIYVQAEGHVNDFRIGIQFERNNQFMCHYCAVDNVIISESLRKAGKIDPIKDQLIKEYQIPAPWLRPHKTFEITPGIAIKDDAVITAIGTNPDLLPILSLNYSNVDSWIKRNPYVNNDFDDPVKSFMFNGSELLDDGNPDHLYTFDKGQDVQWAYVVLYYNYYKNPVPNVSYYGIIRPSDLADTIHGEDYLVLAKLRFVTPTIVDAIFYYPYRKDLAKVDARDVTYLYLNNLRHWDAVRPSHVSEALDILAARLYNLKGILFFLDQKQFDDWRYPIVGNEMGTGHGPVDYWQWRDGLYREKDYDKLAFVVQTNTWWRSYIANLSSTSAGDYFDIEWEEIKESRFQLNWSDVNSGEWPTTRPSNWKYYTGPYSALSGNPGKKGTGEIYDPANLTNDYVNFNTSKNNWPLQYYVVECTGVGSVAIVNPFNIYGTGVVPGPDTDAVKLNKYLRSDNTWQNVPPGTLVFNDYAEFKAWFNNANGSYTSSDLGPDSQYIIKPGRVPDTDYDRIIYVIHDNTWWRTPTDATITWSTSWTGGNVKTAVPTEIKPITNPFEVNWTSWPSPIPGTWTWIGGGTAETTLTGAQSRFPLAYYVVRNTNDPALPFRIVNPFNSSGTGLIPGPTTNEIINGKVLKADGTWGDIVTDFRYYLHGWPQPNMFAGKIISTSTVSISKYYWNVDNLPVGTNLTFAIHKNGVQQALLSVAVGGSYTGNGTITSFSVTVGDIVSIKIISTGTPPNEGGNDLTISLY